jgi:hypothetical protein
MIDLSAMESPWIPYVYQYILGGILFALGILIPLNKKALRLKRQEDRWTLRFLIVGFIIYATVHAVWISLV